MELIESEQNSIKIIQIKGRIDLLDYESLNDKLTEFMDSGIRKLIIDCEKLTFINSSGLRVLILSVKKMENLGGRVIFCGFNENISKVFGITGYLSIFNVYDNLEEAVAGS